MTTLGRRLHKSRREALQSPDPNLRLQKMAVDDGGRARCVYGVTVPFRGDKFTYHKRRSRHEHTEIENGSRMIMTIKAKT